MSDMNGAAATLAAAEAAVRVNPDVIAQIEEMLKRAKNGEIVSMGAACIYPNGSFVPIIVGPRFGDLHLGLSVVTQTVLSHIVQMVQQAQSGRPHIIRPGPGAGA